MCVKKFIASGKLKGTHKKETRKKQQEQDLKNYNQKPEKTNSGKNR